MNDGGKLKQKIFTQLIRFRPVRDVRAHDERCFRLRMAKAVVNTAGINRLVKLVRMALRGIIQLVRRGDAAAVSGCCRNGTRVHEAHARKLPFAGL